MLVDDGIDQELCGIRQDQGGDPVDEHQYESQGEQAAPWAHQLPDFRQHRAEPLDFRRLLGLLGRRTQSLIGLRKRWTSFIITALSHICWTGAAL